MPPTAKPSVLTEYLIGYLNVPARFQALSLEKVYYGDQEHIPRVPAVCVEPAQMVRTLAGTALRTNNEFLVSILVYTANVEGVEDAQRAADLVAEAVADEINADGRDDHQGGTAFGGNAIYGFVRDMEYGYVVKDNKLMRANRMLVYALSRTNLLET